MDAAAQERITGILKSASITPNAQYPDADRLVVRLPSAEDQQKARSAIQTAAQGDYVIALTRESRMPQWMRAVGLSPMALGLDLRGGVQFLYEVDVAGSIGQALDRWGRSGQKASTALLGYPRGSRRSVSNGNDDGGALRHAAIVLA